MLALRAAVLLAAASMAGFFVYVVAVRLAFPYELEWMCGAMLDHVERVRQGLPIYTAPTTAWIPFLYPPLYYWVSALLGGTQLACRTVSLTSTAVVGACVWRLALLEQSTKRWAALGVLTFFAAYFYVGYWYDLERTDMLCMALVGVASVLEMPPPGKEKKESLGRAALSGAVFGAAAFAKQQAVPLAMACGVALGIGGAWRRALTFGVTSLAVVLAGTYWQNEVTGGWFGYYVLHLPAAHGLDFRLWHELLVFDAPRGAGLLAVTLGLTVRLSLDAFRGNRARGFFGVMLFTAWAVSFSSRMHVGGWVNVLLPWVVFSSAAVAIAGSRVERWAAEGGARKAALGSFYVAVLAQLALWVPRTSFGLPDTESRRDAGRFTSLIRELEASGGEVLLAGRGHVTKLAHFQMSGLADLSRVDGPPVDLVEKLRKRSLFAIVDDARMPGDAPSGLWPPVMLEDVAGIRDALFANYYVWGRIADRDARLVMTAPAMPRWIYRARHQPLPEGDGMVRARHVAELALASTRLWDVASARASIHRYDDIEARAAEDVEHARSIP